MSLDGAWVEAVARARGVALTPERAAEIAAAAAPTLELFRTAAAELAADDDPDEFRRLLLEEAARG